MNNIKEATMQMGLRVENSNTLEKEFAASLKDEKFKNLVKKIDLPVEILMKYTSLLEESACEYDNCQNCKNIFECKNKSKGYAYLPKIQNDKFDYPTSWLKSRNTYVSHQITKSIRKLRIMQ
jgi:hypothetical protein